MDLTAGDATAVTRTMSTVDIMNYITANLTVLTSNNMWKRFLFPSSLHNNNNTCNLIALWSHKDVNKTFYHHPVPDHISVHRLMDARNCFAQQFRIFDRGIALICIIISPPCNNRKQLRGTRTIDVIVEFGQVRRGRFRIPLSMIVVRIWGESSCSQSECRMNVKMESIRQRYPMRKPYYKLF
jgi:hypothetical protein